jgi:starch-binding outer membrane protein, SusD/RagB family
MRLNKYILYSAITTGFVLTGISCSDSFLEQPPPGTYSDVSLFNQKGVEGMLIGAYAALDGSYFESWDNNYFNQNSGASNWIWGSVRGGDAYKGTEPSDGVDINPIERYEAQPGNPYLLNKWQGSYDGIGKTNQTLKTLYALVEAEKIEAADAQRIEGEARFLRAHYHFELTKVFEFVPYITEAIPYEDLNTIPNDHRVYPEIEADFLFAFENLPDVQIAAGRANKWAAASYLAKTYMYQGKWAEAKALYDQITTAGRTAGGVTYALDAKFNDNYRVTLEKGNPESIFAFETSINDGTIGNANYENTLNQPHGSSAKFAGCCGFFQPSQNLVNSYKTDLAGLPLIDTYNDTDLKNDEGLASTDAYTPDITTPLDPRLDWTVGRRGLPYLDWGLHPGNNWIRQVANGGPYSPKKNVPYLADNKTFAASYDWGFTATAQNVHIIRYSDVLLLAAEAEAEIGDLGKATEYVNMVRARAANSPVYTYVDNADPSKGFTTTPAANYIVGLYSTFGSRADALKAIRFERKLELGMEGQRFFDLVRWDNATEAGKTQLPFDITAYLNNEYLSKEKVKRNHLSGASFSEKYKYEPIPEYVITQATVAGVRSIDQSAAWGGSRSE